MNWDEVIAQPGFTDLPASAQSQVREAWVQNFVVPELQKAGVEGPQLDSAYREAVSAFDNGQGYITSFLSSAARGGLGTFTGAIQGAGALLESPELEGVGTDLQRGVENVFEVNPALTKTNFVGNALGNAGAFLATGGAGGVAGKALGLGGRLGANIGALGTGFFAGAGGAAQEADQYGITGSDRQMKALLGGAAEVGSEMVFGTGAEMRALSKIPGLRSVADDAGKAALTGLAGAAHAVGTEAAEEVIAQGAGNLTTNLLAPPGVKGPDFTQGFGESALGGAIGGGLFGGVGLLGTHRSDRIAGGAASSALAAGDPAAAAAVVDAASNVKPKTILVPPSSFTGAPDGDLSINDQINFDPNAAPGAGPATVTASGAPVQGIPPTPAGGQTLTPLPEGSPPVDASGAFQPPPAGFQQPTLTESTGQPAIAQTAPAAQDQGTAVAALMPVEERNERMVRLHNVRSESGVGVASPEAQAQAVEDMEKLSGLAPGTLEYVRAGVTKVFRNKITGEFVKFGVQHQEDLERQVDFLKENDTTGFHAPLTITPLAEGAYVVTQAPVGVEGADATKKAREAGRTKEERAADEVLFKQLQGQNPLLVDSHRNGALRIETDQSLKNAGLVVGPDGMVRAHAFDFDGLSQEDIDKYGPEAVEILKNAPAMEGVPLTSFSPTMQKVITEGQVQQAQQAQAPALTQATVQGAPTTQSTGQPAIVQQARPEVAPANKPLKLPTTTPVMTQEEENKLIDTEGRITPEAAVQVAQALKELGISDADIVLTEGESYPGGPANAVLGQVVTENGKETVELNRNMVRADTPVHEVAGHSLLRLLSRLNPALDAAFRKVLVGSPLMAAVKQRYERNGHKYTDEQLYEETLATAFGNNTAKFWAQYAKNPAFVRKIRQLLARLKTWIDNRLKGKGIDPNMTLGDLTKRVNQMILSGQMTEKKAAEGERTAKPSLAPQDAEYMAAVESGDVAKQQAMVDKAAKAAGYDTTPMYHGGTATTVITPRDFYTHDRPVSFLSSSEEHAAVFAGENGTVHRVYYAPGNQVETEEFNNDYEALNGTPYDSVISRGIMDAGHQIDEVVITKPSQVKSADPVTYDAQGNVIPLSQRFDKTNRDVRYSLPPQTKQDTEYAAAVESGDVETQKRIVHETAQAAGWDPTSPFYHGTTHTFNVFSNDRANTENDLGKGFYFTNTPDDADVNYAGEGPDLTGRIEHLADQLYQYDDDNEELFDEDGEKSYELAKKKAKEMLVGDGARTMEAFVKLDNPVVLGGPNPTTFSYNQSYDEETDEFGEPEGSLTQILDAVDAVYFEGFDSEETKRALIDAAVDSDGLTASEVEKIIRENASDATDDNGDMASGEVVRSVFEEAGFDGIEDHTVNQKFGTARRYGRGMDGVNPSTVHRIAFSSSQIKSADPITRDDDGNVIPPSQRFNPANRDVRYSLPPPSGVKPSGVARNQPFSMMRSRFINLSYASENKADSIDQANKFYNKVVNEKGSDPEEHLRVLNDLITKAGTVGVYNMTPGAYFGLLLGDLNAMAEDQTASEAQRSWAEDYLNELGHIWANVAADKGQFIKGFDAGLSIANAPRMQVKWAESLLAFNGDSSLRRDFDKEKGAVIRAGEDLTKEQLGNVPVEDTVNAVGMGVADIAKGEDAADAGTMTMEDLTEPAIRALEDQGEVSESETFIAGYDALTKASQEVFNSILEHMEYLGMLKTHLKGGQYSLVPGAAERSAAARKRLDDFLASSTKSKIDIQTEIDAVQKQIDSSLKKLKGGLMPATAKTPGAAPGAAPATDIQAMATARLFKAIESMIAGPKKGSAKTVAEKTADAIVTAILNKSGLTNQISGGGDMTMALGLLLANQDTAATVLQQVHTMLQNDERTKDALSGDDLKAFMQLAIGKTFDTATGASTEAQPYGEKQIAAVLRAELKKAGLGLEKTVRDAGTARLTRETLEAQLRNSEGALAKNLSPEDLNKVVHAVTAEYEKNAATRAAQLAKEDAEFQVRHRMEEEERQKTEYAQLLATQAEQNSKDAQKAVRDAMAAEQAAAARWEAEQTKQAKAIAKEAQKAVRDAMAAEQKAIVASTKAAAALTERVKKDAERQVAQAMKAQNQSIQKDLRFRMSLKRRARAEARLKRAEEMRQARSAGEAVPSPDPLQWDEIKELNRKLAEDPNKALAVLVREFGFDLSAAVAIIREQGRYDELEQMTKTLADALGMNKNQAAKFVQPVIAAAMKKVSEKRAKEVEKKIASFIKRKDNPDKKTQKTEAQKLMDLVRLGGLTADNVEDVMMNTRGAKKFDPVFRDQLIALAERANDAHLPDTEKVQATAMFNDLIKAARGVSVLGLWGEYTMANIFMAFGTFKVNAIWGAVKSFSDTLAYVTRFDPFNQNPEAQLPKGARMILLKQKLRGFTSDMQYHTKYLAKTGRSPLEYDMTTQFANSDLELISRIPATEIKASLNGEPMSPWFQKFAKGFTKYHKWTRRIMVGTDIANRIPAYEMIKANKILQIMVENGIPINQESFDKHMYGEGGFEQAKEESWAEANKAVAEKRVSESTKGLYFGELMEKRMGAALGVTEEDRKMLLEKAGEEAKRWTVANATEGLLGVVTNSLLATVRDTPGLKFLLPAIRMPIGAFYQGMDWSPYGFLRAKAIGWNKGRSSSLTNALWNRNMDKKGWNLPAYGVPDEMVIELRNKAAIGTSLLTAIAIIIQASIDDDEDEAEFYITAKGPEDAQANKLWREKGMQPFTIRVGGVNIRYQESPAYGPLVAMGAWSDANRYGEPGASTSDRLTYAMTRTVSGFGEAAVLSSLQNVLAAFTGGGAGIEQTTSKMQKALGRMAGVAIAPRIGSEIEQILFGQKDMKEGSWGGYMFANVPFVSSILNKPAINFFGEELHETKGPMGEALPMLAHRVTTTLTDDPQARFVSKIGANKLSTTRRFKDGTEVAENYEAMREWAKTSGQQIRKWLTPQRIAYFERQLDRDRGDAEKEFDSEIRRIREDQLRRIKGVVF